jgi:multicomponent Na+:H+ antiporter subunit F
VELSVHDISAGLLGAGLLLALLRMARGPSVPDRVVALELTSMLFVGMILVQIAGGVTDILLDVAIVLALVGFLATVTFAHYIEKEARDE